jgi:DNA-binding ferritin-like protein
LGNINVKKKEFYMYTEFEKQYKEATKQFEELAERTKQAYEFWVSAVMDTWKDLYSKKK